MVLTSIREIALRYPKDTVLNSQAPRTLFNTYGSTDIQCGAKIKLDQPIQKIATVENYPKYSVERFFLKFQHIAEFIPIYVKITDISCTAKILLFRQGVDLARKLLKENKSKGQTSILLPILLSHHISTEIGLEDTILADTLSDEIGFLNLMTHSNDWANDGGGINDSSAPYPWGQQGFLSDVLGVHFTASTPDEEIVVQNIDVDPIKILFMNLYPAEDKKFFAPEFLDAVDDRYTPDYGTYFVPDGITQMSIEQPEVSMHEMEKYLSFTTRGKEKSIKENPWNWEEGTYVNVNNFGSKLMESCAWFHQLPLEEIYLVYKVPKELPLKVVTTAELKFCRSRNNWIKKRYLNYILDNKATKALNAWEQPDTAEIHIVKTIDDGLYVKVINNKQEEQRYYIDLFFTTLLSHYVVTFELEDKNNQV